MFDGFLVLSSLKYAREILGLPQTDSPKDFKPVIAREG